jgi:hypothetical protein
MDNKIRVTFDAWGYAMIVSSMFLSDFVSEYFDTIEEAQKYVEEQNEVIRNSFDNR